jgi:hypothetical protein
MAAREPARTLGDVAIGAIVSTFTTVVSAAGEVTALTNTPIRTIGLNSRPSAD